MKSFKDQLLTIDEYFSDHAKVLNECLADPNHQKGLLDAVAMMKKTKDIAKIILVGNGGSAAIAEHMAVDLTKNAGLCAMTISGTPMLTTLANDCGYENVYAKGIDVFGKENDVLIAISSGGTSKNILNACDVARQKKMKVITFSGFSSDNPLRQKGDINIWVNSQAYGYVEMIHNLLIHYINDAVIGKAVYKF